MSAPLDLTEAIEAAKQALKEAGHDAPSVEASVAVHAVAPLIAKQAADERERQVRDRIAADILAQRIGAGIEPAGQWALTVNSTREDDARIARGVQP